MAYCRKCGEQIDDEAVICPKCGVPQNKNYGNNEKNTVNDTGGSIYVLLGAIFPVIALIMYLIWKDERPKTSADLEQGMKICLIIIGIIIVWYVVELVIAGGVI